MRVRRNAIVNVNDVACLEIGPCAWFGRSPKNENDFYLFYVHHHLCREIVNVKVVAQEIGVSWGFVNASLWT